MFIYIYYQLQRLRIVCILFVLLSSICWVIIARGRIVVLEVICVFPCFTSLVFFLTAHYAKSSLLTALSSILSSFTNFEVFTALRRRYRRAGGLYRMFKWRLLFSKG